ncbi:hypothetical protein ACQW02_12265 [Humitalea sp. 24SJ18S-53]|uniref:hypothetical protein n=1 Tax=Humitalea sp. 24SJ18S-53 TaxID=3422307 RepID=UPI003D66FD51
MQQSDGETADLSRWPEILDGLVAEAHGLDGILVAWRKFRYALRSLHSNGSTADWQTACSILRAHPLHALALEDPFTRHAVVKPRGYPGDAVLLDYVYRLGAAPRQLREATPAGRDVNAVTTELSLPVAARERCRILARTVDATAHRCRGRGAEILALAGGHLREASIAHAPAEGGVLRWISLDQDPLSADEAARSHAHLPCIVPICAPVGPLMSRPLLHGRFDLIYSASLFNYLDRETALAMLAAMLLALKPGGQALIAFTSSGLLDAPYFDAVQDWQLDTRDDSSVQDLLDSLPPDEIASKRVMHGTNGDLLYGLLTRRG